mgnify:CR=1 FL=1
MSHVTDVSPSSSLVHLRIIYFYTHFSTQYMVVSTYKGAHERIIDPVLHSPIPES